MQKQMLREHREHREGEEHVGVLLAALRRRIRQVVRAEAGSHRLSPQQFWSLVGIDEAGPLSLGAIAERLRMDQPTASRVVQSLTKRRLVHLSEDPADRRRLLIDTTAEGETLAAKIRPTARDLRLALVEGFSAAELAALRGALLKIAGNLDRFEARRSRRPARAAQAREEHA
jgi:MarR family transcriptional regulator for hemolysin